MMIWGMPKFTVIIQGFNDRGFFDQSIKSALNQTFKDYEVVLSSDGNPALEGYADKYGIKFSLSKPSNHSGSVNHAISNTDSDWIKVLDDDDLMLPNSLQKAWDNKNKGDLLQGDAVIVKGDEIFIYKGKEISILSLLPIVMNPVNWATVSFSRAAYDSVGGFDTNVHFANDYDLYLNFLSHGFKIGLINGTMGIYRLHDNQMSKNLTHYRKLEKEYLIRKYSKFIN
mgnify:CR=1 FL=1